MSLISDIRTLNHSAVQELGENKNFTVSSKENEYWTVSLEQPEQAKQD